MSHILCFTDDSPAADTVRSVAASLGTFLHKPVEEITVGHDAHGSTAELLMHALLGPKVLVAVLGSRSVSSKTDPLGHVAMDLMSGSTVPLVLVSPECQTPDPDSARVLLPLDASAVTDKALAPFAELLRMQGATILPAHIFTAQSVPPFLSSENLRVLSKEFTQQHLVAGDDRTELRLGEPAARILALVEEKNADAVLVAWHRDLSPGKADVLRALLSAATIPVIAVPILPEPSPGDSGPA